MPPPTAMPRYLGPTLKPYNFVGEHFFEEMARRARATGDRRQEEIAIRNLRACHIIAEARKNPDIARMLWEGRPDKEAPRYPDERPGEPEVYVYSAGNKEILPGTMVISDTDKPDEVTQDQDAIRIWRSSKNDYLKYLRVYWGLNSMDGEGIDHYHTVHFGRDFNNAFMTKSTDRPQMVYGDGDKENFNSFAQPGVNWHENGHLRTDAIAGSAPEGFVADSWLMGGLIYRGQPGALNEAYSDFDAILVSLSEVADGIKIRDLPREAWLVGADLFVRPFKNDPTKRQALRSFLDEIAYDDEKFGKDIQPKHMRDYYEGPRDRYGVHINSGIINHGVYLTAKYLDETMDVDVKGVVKIMTAVWKLALTRMHNRTTFKEAVQQWLKAAQDLYPNQPKVYEAVKKAFTDVGIIGPQAASVDHVLEVSDTFEADELNVPLPLYQDVKERIARNYETLEAIPGFTRASVGARVRAGNVELVAMVFVEKLQDSVTYPKDLEGYEIVVREEVPVLIDKNFDPQDPFHVALEKVRYLR